MNTFQYEENGARNFLCKENGKNSYSVTVPQPWNSYVSFRIMENETAFTHIFVQVTIQRAACLIHVSNISIIQGIRLDECGGLEVLHTRRRRKLDS